MKSFNEFLESYLTEATDEDDKSKSPKEAQVEKQPEENNKLLDKNKK